MIDEKKLENQVYEFFMDRFDEFGKWIKRHKTSVFDYYDITYPIDETKDFEYALNKEIAYLEMYSVMTQIASFFERKIMANDTETMKKYILAIKNFCETFKDKSFNNMTVSQLFLENVVNPLFDCDYINDQALYNLKQLGLKDITYYEYLVK